MHRRSDHCPRSRSSFAADVIRFSPNVPLADSFEHANTVDRFYRFYPLFPRRSICLTLARASYSSLPTSYWHPPRTVRLSLNAAITITTISPRSFYPSSTLSQIPFGNLHVDSLDSASDIFPGSASWLTGARHVGKRERRVKAVGIPRETLGEGWMEDENGQVRIREGY
jgi:hypothetical protein